MIKTGVELEINGKNVASEMERIGKLAKQALNFDPQNKELQQMVSTANELYASINKTNDALQLQQKIGKAIADQAQAQSYVDRYSKQKKEAEDRLDKAITAGKDPSEQQKELKNIDKNLSAAQDLKAEYDGILADLQNELRNLQATGADVDKSLTFENSKVQASGLLDLLNQVEQVSNDTIKKVGEVNEHPINIYSDNGETTPSTMFDTFNEEIEHTKSEIETLSQDIDDLFASSSGAELEAGLAEMQDRVDDIDESIQFLTDDAMEMYSSVGKVNLSGLSADEVIQYDAEVEKTVASAQSLNEVLAEVQSKLPPIEIDTSEVEDATQAVENLTTAEQEAISQPVENIEMEDVTEDAEEATYTYQELSATLYELEDRMKKIKSGEIVASDQEIINLQAEINDASSALDDYTEKIQRAANGNQEFEQSSSRVGEAFSRIGDAIRNSITPTKIESSGKDIQKTVSGGITSSFKKLQGTVDKTFSGKSFKRGLNTVLKYGFGIRSLYFAFRKLRKAVKDGLDNLVKYENKTGSAGKGVKSTNKAMSQLQTSLLYLKNAWAAAFAPIINTVMPLLTKLIDGIANAANYIAKFVGALTGQKIVLNAVKTSTGNYAENLEKASDNAKDAANNQKKLNDRLAQFDDLDVLGQDNDTGSSDNSSSGFTPDPADMFKIVKTDDAQSLVDMLIDAWKNADFTKIGELLKDKILEGLQYIQNHMSDIEAFLTKVANSIGSFFVGLLSDPKLYEKIGTVSAQLFNAFNRAVSAFLQQIKKIPLGKNIAKMVNNAVKTASFRQFGENIKDAISTSLKNIKEFFDETDKKAVANAIATFLESLDLPKLALQAFEATISLTKAVVEVGSNLIIRGADDLADAIWKDVTKGWETDIEGKKLTIKTDFDVNSQPIQAMIDNMYMRIGELGYKIIVGIGAIFGKSEKDVRAKLDAIFGTTEGKFEDATKAGLEKGAEKGMNDVTSTVQTDVESGAKTGAEQGTSEGITAGAHSAGGSDSFASVQNSLQSAMYKGSRAGLLEGLGVSDPSIVKALESDGNYIVQGLATGIVAGFGNSETWTAKNITDPITNGVESNMKISSPSKVAEEWGVFIIEGLANGIASMYDTLTQKWDEIKGIASTKMQDTFNVVSQKATDIKNDLYNTWGIICSNVDEKLSSVKSKFIEIFNGIKDGLKTPINGILGIVQSMINKIINGINGIIDKLNSLPNLQFKNPFNGQDYKLGFNIPKLGTITIPKLAEGAVIPPNREFLATLGDQSHGTNIEAPLDTIKQAVAEVMANNGNQEMIRLLQQLITVVENKNLVIGDKAIGQANARYNNQQKMIRGTSF